MIDKYDVLEAMLWFTAILVFAGILAVITWNVSVFIMEETTIVSIVVGCFVGLGVAAWFCSKFDRIEQD